MAKNIFARKEANIVELPVPSGQETPIVAELKVGGTKRNFILNGKLIVRQGDRVQVDASADGTMHVVTCRGAVGYCDIPLLDRKIGCINNSDFAIKCYASDMKSLADRKATVTLYPSQDVPVSFSGVIVGADVSVQYGDNGLLFFTTVLHMMGSWDK